MTYPYLTPETAPGSARTTPAANDAQAANAAGPKVEVYHKTWCPYSRAAVALLNEKGVIYEDLDVTDDRVLEQEMIQRSGRTSVPEIFINGDLVGGYDELAALDAHDMLDPLLGIGNVEGKAAA